MLPPKQFKKQTDKKQPVKNRDEICTGAQLGFSYLFELHYGPVFLYVVGRRLIEPSPVQCHTHGDCVLGQSDEFPFG